MKKLPFIFCNVFVYCSFAAVGAFLAGCNNEVEKINSSTQNTTKSIEGTWYIYVNDDMANITQEYTVVENRFMVMQDNKLTFYVNDNIALQGDYDYSNDSLVISNVTTGNAASLPSKYSVEYYTPDNIAIFNKESGVYVYKMVKVESMNITQMTDSDLAGYYDISAKEHKDDDRSLEFTTDKNLIVYQGGKSIATTPYSWCEGKVNYISMGLNIGVCKMIEGLDNHLYMIQTNSYAQLWDLVPGTK